MGLNKARLKVVKEILFYRICIKGKIVISLLRKYIDLRTLFMLLSLADWLEYRMWSLFSSVPTEALYMAQRGVGLQLQRAKWLKLKFIANAVYDDLFQ